MVVRNKYQLESYEGSYEGNNISYIRAGCCMDGWNFYPTVKLIYEHNITALIILDISHKVYSNRRIKNTQ